MKYNRKKWEELTQAQQREFTIIMDRGKVAVEGRKGFIYQVFEDGTVRGFLMASNFTNPFK